MKVIKIISGGQTGADMGGLLAAKHLNLETGGMAPRDYRTEKGSNMDLKTIFGLVESPYTSYNHRTGMNIHGSDGTMIFSPYPSSPGTLATIRECRIAFKPFLVNPTLAEARIWLEKHNIQILNVAGNRESVAPGIQDATKRFLLWLLEENGPKDQGETPLF